MALPASEDPAGLRSMAPAPATRRRVTRRPPRRARSVRRPGLRAVGGAGAARAARVRRAEPTSRPRGARPADRTGAADRAARGKGPLEPRDRAAALPLAPHHQHAPVPRLPEARDHLAGRAGRRAGTRRRIAYVAQARSDVI